MIPASIAAVVCVLGWRWLALVEQARHFARFDETESAEVGELRRRLIVVERMAVEFEEMQSKVTRLAMEAGMQ